jgi:creatinine amidohydrolase
MFLEEMKWPEVSSLQRDRVVVVCCISALEQHSLHLPMGTDYFIGAELLRRLEGQAPDQILCLPALWLGASDHHMDFAGTISASTLTVMNVLHDIASSVQQHGFKKLLFVNSHGGNRALLGCSVQEIGHRYPDMTIIGATYWDVAREELLRIRETEYGGMGHACELETSIILAISSGLVDMSKAQYDGTMASSQFTKGEMLFAPQVATYRSMKDGSRHGGFGDPTVATSKKGFDMLDAIVVKLTALCEDILENRI